MKNKYKPNREIDQESQPITNAEVLFFYANWCPYCKKAQPIWDSFKADNEGKVINGYKVYFIEVDCSEESSEVVSLMNKYKIEGFPTIKLIKSGQVIDFDANVTADNLTQFLDKML